MRILHVTPYYAPSFAFGGVVSAVVGLAENQANRGHNVWVLTTDARERSGRPLERHEQIEGVYVSRRPNLSAGLRRSLNLSTPLGFRAETDRIIREQRIQVVHFHEFRTTESLLALPTVSSANIPTILSPHGTLPYSSGRWWAKRLWDLTVGHGSANWIDQVIALTEDEADQVRHLWTRLGVSTSPQGIDIIPNGTRLAQPASPEAIASFRRRWYLGTGFVAIFVGRLTPRKGLQVMMDAFAALADSDPNARLLIVGPDEGTFARNLKSTSLKRFGGRVVFTGFLRGEALQAALSASDVFLLPATGEGLPMAALEAMAAGLPIIISPGSGLDLVADWGAGMVIPPKLEPLSNALLELADRPPLRARMAKRARELAMNQFTWERVAPKVQLVYETALKER